MPMRYKNCLLLGVLFVASCTHPSLKGIKDPSSEDIEKAYLGEIQNAYPIKFDVAKAAEYFGHSVEYLTERKRKFNVRGESVIATLDEFNEADIKTDSGRVIWYGEEAYYREMNLPEASNSYDEYDVYDEPKIPSYEFQDAKGLATTVLSLKQYINLPPEDYKSYRKAHKSYAKAYRKSKKTP